MVSNFVNCYDIWEARRASREDQVKHALMVLGAAGAAGAVAVEADTVEIVVRMALTVRIAGAHLILPMIRILEHLVVVAAVVVAEEEEEVVIVIIGREAP